MVNTLKGLWDHIHLDPHGANCKWLVRHHHQTMDIRGGLHTDLRETLYDICPCLPQGYPYKWLVRSYDQTMEPSREICKDIRMEVDWIVVLKVYNDIILVSASTIRYGILRVNC